MLGGTTGVAMGDLRIHTLTVKVQPRPNAHRGRDPQSRSQASDGRSSSTTTIEPASESARTGAPIE